MEEKIIAKANDLFAAINEFVSKGDNYLLDKSFPNREGVENDEYLATLYELQQVLYSVDYASKIALKHVSDVIEISESK
jgi:endo-alpha-1,4-polygalactosaminidase (GH114 family)